MGASLIQTILQRSLQNILQNMKPANLFSNNTQLKKSINLVLQIWLVLDSAKIKAMDDTEMTPV